MQHYWKKKWLNNEWVCMQMAAPCWHDLFTHFLLWNCPDINILYWHLLNVLSTMLWELSHRLPSLCTRSFVFLQSIPPFLSFIFALRSCTYTHSVHYAFNHQFYNFVEKLLFSEWIVAQGLCVTVKPPKKIHRIERSRIEPFDVLKSC